MRPHKKGKPTKGKRGRRDIGVLEMMVIGSVAANISKKSKSAKKGK
jgi:hypothetical protein